MLHATARTICVNLLIGGYLAECFVLLTANVEDIKQIAKKFLSESLSEQLEGFLSKAKSKDTLSEENEKNAQEYANSREQDQNRDEYNEYHQQDKAFNYDKKPRFDVAKQHSIQQYSISREPHPNANIISKREKLKKRKNDKYNTISNNKNSMLINSGYNNEVYKPPKYGLNYREATHFQRNKKLPMNGGIDSVGQMSNLGGYKKNVQPTTERRLPSEFDQYDVSGRNDLATSGYVALPRIRDDVE